MSSKTKHLIIFDFDGVLADSFNTFYSLIRDAMNHIGFKITQDQYRNFHIGNVHQEFRDFINNEKKYSIFLEFRTTNYDKYYYDKKLRAKLFPEAVKFVKKIAKKYILTIASSGKKENIKNLLKEEGINNLFSLILADSSYSKEGMIKEILDKFQTKPRESFFITDTVGDIKIAKKMGLATVAVTWGFHNKKNLILADPDFIVSAATPNFKILSSHLLKGI